MRAPRFFACSSSSRTRMPAPSPGTNPSRPRSNGREAFCRLVVPLRERARLGEAADAQEGDGGLGAAADHQVGVAVLQVPHGLADGVVAGGAGRHRRVVDAARAVLDRDLPRREVDDDGRDEERADPLVSLVDRRQVRLFQRRETAHAGADDDARASPSGLSMGSPASCKASCAPASAYWMKRSFRRASLLSM